MPCKDIYAILGGDMDCYSNSSNVHPILKITVNGQKAIQYIFDYETSINTEVVSQLQRQLLRNLTNEIKLMI